MNSYANRQGWLSLLFRTGWLAQMQKVWGGECLTVLAYHRVTDPYQQGFDTFRPVVSATPEQFGKQLDLLQSYFQVVSLKEVAAWQGGEGKLPAYPALLTFDDGYADNYYEALPALQQRNLPAVIFLSTAYMSQSHPFFWDGVAYCFHHTERTKAVLPGIGAQSWTDSQSKEKVMMQWLSFLKRQPEAEKKQALAELPLLLGVSPNQEAFRTLYLTWDQVRVMCRHNIHFGAHTHTHPIMTRIPLQQAQQEARWSKERIEAEIDQKVIAFAYPNGQKTDFNQPLQQMLAKEAFQLAFTLLPGPARPLELRQQPFAIRRIAVHYRDDLPRFAGKLFGLTRILGRPR